MAVAAVSSSTLFLREHLEQRRAAAFLIQSRCMLLRICWRLLSMEPTQLLAVKGAIQLVSLPGWDLSSLISLDSFSGESAFTDI